MEEIDILAEYVAIGVNILAIAAIAVGSIQGAVGLARGLLTNASEDDLRPVWLAFGRWLVAGLPFQLASDIVETTFAPTWDHLGKPGPIAVLRTFHHPFLNNATHPPPDPPPPP